MRLLLIADTHGCLDPRIERIAASVDHIVHAGDVGDGVAERLVALGAETTIVTGNCDSIDCGWPETAWLSLPGGFLAVVHGHRWQARDRHARLRAALSEARLVVYGHSHRRVQDDATRPVVVNPGAAGKTRAYGGPGAIELDVSTDGWCLTWHVFEPLSRQYQALDAALNSAMTPSSVRTNA